jgi:hypothetical protein
MQIDSFLGDICTLYNKKRVSQDKKGLFLREYQEKK